MGDKKIVSVNLDKELWQKVRVKAIELGETYSGFVTEALTTKLEEGE